MNEVLIRMNGISYSYNGRVVLDSVTMSVKKGEFIGVIGPNGSGKSTLLLGILGLIQPTSGRMTVLGSDYKSLSRVRKFLGYVPQRSLLDPTFPATVNDVVLMGLYGTLGFTRRPGRSEQEQVLNALDLVDMADFVNRPIGQLSGGQFQRVLIARALVSNPSILLLDEPTSAVDVRAEHSILAILDDLNRRAGLTVIMVTHNVNEIVHVANNLAIINGCLEGYGPPSEVLNTETVARVFGGYVQVCAHGNSPLMIVGDGLV